MRISDWSSDVCSSDLPLHLCDRQQPRGHVPEHRAVERTQPGSSQDLRHMLATARVPPVVNGELGRPGADLFGAELVKGGRRVLVLSEYPAGAAAVAVCGAAAGAPVRTALAGALRRMAK